MSRLPVFGRAGLAPASLERLAGHLRQQLRVDRDHRRQAAAADASNHLQVELAVGRRLSRSDAQCLGGLIEQLGRALEIAGRAQADGDDVLAGRLQPEVVVEGQDFVDACQRHVHLLAQAHRRFAWHIAVSIL